MDPYLGLGAPADAAIDRICRRGVIWRAADGTDSGIIGVTCVPLCDAEADLWRWLVGHRPETIWGLSEAVELPDGRFRLVTSAQPVTPLLRWLAHPGRGIPPGNRWSSLLDRARDLVDALPTDLPGRPPNGAESALAQVMVADTMELRWAAVPWLQCDGWEETGATSDEAAGWITAASRGRCADADTRVDGRPSEIVGHPDMDDPPVEKLPPTAEIPVGILRRVGSGGRRMRRVGRLRVGSVVLVTALAAACTAGISLWRLDAVVRQSCPSSAVVAQELTRIMNERAAAIMGGDQDALQTIEAEPMLSQDREVLAQMRRDGIEVTGVSFDVGRVGNIRCRGGVIEARASIGQGPYRRCSGPECTGVARRGPEELELRLDAELSRLLSIRRREGP